MKQKALSFWQAEPRYRKIAFLVGFLVMLTGVIHLVAFPFAQDASWSGPTGFRKTIVFGISAGFTVITMTWLLRFYQPRPKLHSAMMLAISAALTIEIVIVDLQRIRGVPSHFNIGTPFDLAMWTIMGVSILVFAIIATIQAVLAWGKLNAPPAMAMAIRASMAIFFLSQLSGQQIVSHGMSVVLQDGVFILENVSKATTFGEAGDLKLPHAITLHAIQIIPLLGLMIARLHLSAFKAQFWVALSSVGFLGISIIAQIQAYLGKRIQDLDTVGAAAIFVSIAAFAIPFAYAIVGNAARWSLSGKPPLKTA